MTAAASAAHGEDGIKVGDVVRMKAGGEFMTVTEVVSRCDGTGHDGAGVLCAWFEGTTLKKAWLSESSLDPQP